MIETEIILWVVCIVEFALLCILGYLGFVPTEGVFEVDETDPEDVKMRMRLPEDVESGRRIILKVIHKKDSCDKK